VERLKVERSGLKAAVEMMRSQGFDYLVKITAVDYIDHLGLLYFVRNTESNKDDIVEMSIPAKDPWTYTVTEYHKSADWYERELSEMFGIRIEGRVAKRLLLEKWDGTGAPLRKSFEWDKPYETKESVKK
jgi:NADH-quinone oxidoreductase subunit C